MQEIHCMISKKTGEIVDGEDDRLMSYEYRFALQLHDSPDIEEIGHEWQIVEVQPTQAIKLLVWCVDTIFIL